MVRRRIIGTKHEKYVIILNKMGLVYQIIQEFIKALELHQECLAILKLLYSMSHSKYADTLENIAIVHESLGRNV